MHFHVMTGTVHGAPDYLVRCNTLQQAEDHAAELIHDVGETSYLEISQCVFRDSEPICQADLLSKAVM